MNKRFSTYVTMVLSLSCLCPAAVWADGKAWIYSGKDRSSAKPLKENEQRAAIVHKDGIERMLLAINIATQGQDQAVWMFPVPGKPSEVDVNLLDEFPIFEGKNSIAAARQYGSTVLDVALMTQLYPLPFFLCTITSLGLKEHASSQSQPAYVSKEINRYGLTTKVIQADSITALAEYFQQNQVTMSPEQLASFEPYTKGGYVFIVTWITSADELNKVFPDLRKDDQGFITRRPCVYVQFPSKDIFYPMRPTAAYGDESVPFVLYVLDYVKLIGPDKMESAEVAYYRQDWIKNLPDTFKDFLNKRKLSYTRIASHESAQAKDYRNDLYFTPDAAFGQRFSDLLADISEAPRLAAIVGFLVILIISYLSSGLAGVILHHTWKGSAGYGYYNLLTLLMYYHMLKNKFPEDSADPKQNQLNRTERIRMTLYFTLVFLVLVAVLYLSIQGAIPDAPYMFNSRY